MSSQKTLIQFLSKIVGETRQYGEKEERKEKEVGKIVEMTLVLTSILKAVTI